jgi:PAS domain S-box-containing protein
MKNKTQLSQNKTEKKPNKSQKKASEINQELQKQKEQFNALLDAIPDLVYLKDKSGKNLMVNKAFADFLGLKKEDIIGKTDRDFLSPDLAEQCQKSDEEVFKRKDVITVDEQSKEDSKDTVYFNTIKSPIFDKKGKIKGLVGISRDLTSLMKKEEQIKKSLKEKEALLKEIHHRVKNNMQIISSLINLQASTTNDPNVKQKFNQCRSRIKAMALVHDRLYRSSSLSKIDFSNYIRTLATHLMSLNQASERNIELDLELDKIYLDIAKSIPLGLITNELISNSFKHAFPEPSLFNQITKEPKKVQVNLKKNRNNEIELVVKDNGIGLPENFKDKANKSLGINLIQDLVKQIKGNLMIDRTQGTVFKINFFL